MEIRPGAVREARLEAGLSLADVADGQLTRAAIHLIEAGRSRPSMPTLELISRQTGKPINFFLAGDGARPAQNPAFAGAIAESGDRPAAAVGRARYRPLDAGLYESLSGAGPHPATPP